MSKFFIFISILLLGGCTSFDGRPSPVLEMEPAVNLVQKEYTPEKVIVMYNSLDPITPAKRREYRDQVLFAYLNAADARYSNYLIGLSKQAKGANILLDIATLGLTSGVAIAGEKTGQAL